MLLAFVSASATDKLGESFASVMTITCGDYVEARKLPHTLRYAQNSAWIAGYITAYNRLTPDTYSIFGNSNLASVELWLDSWCMANPLRNLPNGMEALIVELYPKRHRTEQ